MRKFIVVRRKLWPGAITGRALPVVAAAANVSIPATRVRGSWHVAASVPVRSVDSTHLWNGGGTIVKRVGSDGLLLASNLSVASLTAVAASNSTPYTRVLVEVSLGDIPNNLQSRGLGHCLDSWPYSSQFLHCTFSMLRGSGHSLARCPSPSQLRQVIFFGFVHSLDEWPSSPQLKQAWDPPPPPSGQSREKWPTTKTLY